jgi:hypothetical protein
MREGRTMRLTLLLAVAAFGAALLGVTQAGEASTHAPLGAYQVTVSGTVTYSWTLGYTQQTAGCTTRGNGSGSESIRFQSAKPSSALDVFVRGRRVWIQRYISGPLTGSVTRQGDATLSRSGPQCSETRVAPKEGCGTVDFSGTTGATGYYFGGRGGFLIFRPGAIRNVAGGTRTCVSSLSPDGALHGFCCQADDRGAGRLEDPRVPLRPKGSTKNRFRLSGRITTQWPLRLMDANVRAGTITVTSQWSALFVRAGRGSGR